MAAAKAGKHILCSYTPSHLANTILTSRSALTGERKHVTVLFTDLEDSTALAQEDAQWLDSGSQELLDRLVAGLARRPILLLCTARPGCHYAWRDQPGVHELTLAALSRDQTDVFVHHWCWPHNASSTLKVLIRQRTEGNPFLIEEMLRALQEHHRLAIQNGEFVVRGEDVKLPASVQGVLAARIDRREANLKEVVQVGSVIGQEFPLWLLEAVLGQTDLQGKLATLAQLGLIYEKALRPEPTYVFTHALTRDVAYMSLLNQVKKRLHQVIGVALESRYAERLDEQIHLLYHHFSRAEHWLKAAQYGWQAARKAHRLNQCHAAVTLLDQARACVLRLPEGQSRQEALLDLQLEMIWSLRNLGQPDQMLSRCREAEVVARLLADRVRLGKVLLGYGNSYAYKGAFAQAEAYYRQALEQFAGTGEEALSTFGQYCLAVAYQAQSQWQKAVPFFAESLRTQEAHHTQTQYPDWEVDVLPYAYSCATFGYNLALQGRTHEAKALLSKGSTPAIERVANLFTKTYCAVWHSRFAVLMGEDYGALARAEDVLRGAEATDSPTFRFHGYLAQGTALLAVEQYAAARTACERALQAIIGTSHGDGLGLVYFNLAWASLALADRAAAERYYQAGRRPTSRFALLRAQLLAAGDPPDFAQAESCFEQSMWADEATGAVVLVAQTRYYLAQMLARKGDLERAHRLLTGLCRQFHAWDMPVWQRKCGQALATLHTGFRLSVPAQSSRPFMDQLRELPEAQAERYAKNSVHL
jgi:tetratricopeptide (TPR) repeat protein